MRILVTGASGHFGGAAARMLIERISPRDLILMTRKPEKLAALKGAGCEVRYGDFDDEASLEAAAQGAEKMLLISGMKVGYRIGQHSRAIDAAKKAGVRHIVYTSYIGATKDNPALIAKDHFGTEEKLRASGLKWTAMRDGLYMNSMVEAAAPPAIKFGRWVTASGEGKTGLIDRAECVGCAVTVLLSAGHDKHVYNISGTELWSTSDMAALMSEISGKPIEVAHVDRDGFYAHFDAMGVPREPLTEFNVGGIQWCSDDIVSYELAMRDGHFAVPSQDVRTLLGRPAKGFRQFALERADFIRGCV
ncbi:MAG: SDR family oxidoreductase [Hyphomonadaceae bacterium]|nr:SDR family oxidoreductase [Hyphomonadaceae bacterium]